MKKGIDVAKRSQADVPAAHTRGEQRIGELLDIAAEVFLEFGFQATSMSTIARRAKASKETFYSRYANKEELFKAVVFRKTESVNDHFRALLSEDRPVKETLIAFGDELLDLLLQPASINRLRIVSMEARRFPVVGAEFYRDGPGRVNQLLTSFLEERQRCGELKTIDPSLAAEQLVEMASTSLVRKRLLGVLFEVPAEERKKRVRSAVDLFMAGYAAPVMKAKPDQPRET